MRLSIHVAVALVFSILILLGPRLAKPDRVAQIPGVPPIPVPLPNVPKLPPLPIPDISQLIEGQDPITTNLSDAVTGIPFLNDYQPFGLRYLPVAARKTNGSYSVPSGSYIFEARSYCLHAGKHGTVRGTGYLLAPLKGPRAPMIHDILVKSADNPGIPQQNVQMLIWSILARARFSNLGPELRADAARLLTPTEILQLNESAIGVVPENQLYGLLAKVPAPLQSVVQAENSLRNLLTNNGTYAAMEGVAVLPPLNQPSTPVAPVRWSFDPQGQFVSFVPHSYQWTTNFIDVPGAVYMQQDSLGRVSTLRDRNGNSLRLSYGASGVTVPGDPQAHFYQIRSIGFTWRQVLAGRSTIQTRSWTANRWVMTGVPSGSGNANGLPDVPNAPDLYQVASSFRNQFTSLLKTVHGNTSALPQLIALAQLPAAFRGLWKRQRLDSAVVANEMNFPYVAWESEFADSIGGHIATHARLAIDDPPNPANSVANPQDPNAQRLAQSPTCHELPPGAGTIDQEHIAAGLSQGGYPTASSNPQNIAYDILQADTNLMELNFSINLDREGKPVAPCAQAYWTIGGTVTKQRMFDFKSNKQWTEYKASINISQGEQIVSAGEGSSGSKRNSGNLTEAVANALRTIHYHFP